MIYFFANLFQCNSKETERAVQRKQQKSTTPKNGSRHTHTLMLNVMFLDRVSPSLLPSFPPSLFLRMRSQRGQRHSQIRLAVRRKDLGSGSDGTGGRNCRSSARRRKRRGRRRNGSRRRRSGRRTSHQCSVFLLQFEQLLRQFVDLQLLLQLFLQLADLLRLITSSLRRLLTRRAHVHRRRDHVLQTVGSKPVGRQILSAIHTGGGVRLHRVRAVGIRLRAHVRRECRRSRRHGRGPGCLMVLLLLVLLLRILREPGPVRPLLGIPVDTFRVWMVSDVNGRHEHRSSSRHRRRHRCRRCSGSGSRHRHCSGGGGRRSVSRCSSRNRSRNRS